MTKAELEKMFLNKTIKITSTYGPEMATFEEKTTGVCTAIHETLGIKDHFDVEIDNHDRYSIISPVLKENKCVAFIRSHSSRPRIIEVV